MPRYFIDHDDGDGLTRDDAGCDFADLKAVRAGAIAVLQRLATDTLSDGNRRTLSTSVRNEAGTVVHTARFDYHAETYSAQDNQKLLENIADALLQAHTLSRQHGNAVIQALIEKSILYVGEKIADETGLKGVGIPLS